MNFRTWYRSGTPWVWLNAGALSISLIAVIGLLLLIASRGLVHFWPATLHSLEYRESSGKVVRVIGEYRNDEVVPGSRVAHEYPALAGQAVARTLYKVGNRDLLSSDFRWLVDSEIQQRSQPSDLVNFERYEWGNLYGYVRELREQGQSVVLADAQARWTALQERLDRAAGLQAQAGEIQAGAMRGLNHRLEQLRLDERRLNLRGRLDADAQTRLAAERARIQAEYAQLQARLDTVRHALQRDSVQVEISDGRVIDLPLAKVVQAYRPNAMSLTEKLGFYAHRIWEFVSTEPREANTEGGVFPAIFGTVMLVLLMSVVVTPFGVVAAVYLREYAKQGFVTRVVRIAVNNLAGVPSIVYGVFGLGFFVYGLGGSIDQLFFPEALPAPTFGTPGILWSALTLALLTVPVVIVATEEGLARIPRSIREGSLALGATKAETLWRTVLPMASPAMMTGLILAIARAAGEVAPLMLVGVVKLAPTLPVDGYAPYVHLERKFMHLGFHIHDVGFQSPNVEAARPLVYATALLLVLIIIGLNLVAIILRNRLRERYRALEN